MANANLGDGRIVRIINLLYQNSYISPPVGDILIDRIKTYASRHSNWIVPGKGIKTNIQVLQKLRERKIKGQLWRVLRGTPNPSRSTGSARGWPAPRGGAGGVRGERWRGPGPGGGEKKPQQKKGGRARGGA